MRLRSLVLAALAGGAILGVATAARADDDDFGHWGLSFSFGPGYVAAPPPAYYAPPPRPYYYRPPPVYYAPPPPPPYYAAPVYSAPWGRGDDDDEGD